MYNLPQNQTTHIGVKRQCLMFFIMFVFFFASLSRFLMVDAFGNAVWLVQQEIASVFMGRFSFFLGGRQAISRVWNRFKYRRYVEPRLSREFTERISIGLYEKRVLQSL